MPRSDKSSRAKGNNRIFDKENDWAKRRFLAIRAERADEHNAAVQAFAQQVRSVAGETMAYTEPVERYPEGRRCSHKPCETVLSTYNEQTTCSLHRDPRDVQFPMRLARSERMGG